MTTEEWREGPRKIAGRGEGRRGERNPTKKRASFGYILLQKCREREEKQGRGRGNQAVKKTMRVVREVGRDGSKKEQK